jgi:D-lyxose ketol-isomerase
MKRSEINAVMKRTEALVDRCGFRLPQFFYWTAEDWKNRGSEYDEIRDNMLGWDVTDYGSGNWNRRGMALMTIRNGSQKNPGKYPKTYCEKLALTIEGQEYPNHFHWVKMEDIINRGGGILEVGLFNVTGDNKPADSDVTVISDGRSFRVPAGQLISLEPGQSLTMLPKTFHFMRVRPGSGEVLLGEVSMVNDDLNDNFFLDAQTRFSPVEEDEAPYHLLCNEYPTR